MVRLERIAYERLFNNKVLGRAREIVTPKNINYYQDEIILRSWPSKYIQLLFLPLIQKIQDMDYRIQRDNYLDSGQTFDEVLMESDQALLRCPFTEHFIRESMNPMHVNLIKYRIQAYDKVDTKCKGFIVPDYFREEARMRTYSQAVQKIDTYHKMKIQNYYKEQTQRSYFYHGSMVVLDIVNFANFMSRTSWNKFFFNEKSTVSVGEYLENVKDGLDKFYTKKDYNLDNQSDRKRWAKDMETFNKQNPGYMFPDGMKIDPMELLDNEEKRRELLQSEINLMLQQIEDDKKQLTQQEKVREEVGCVSGMVDGWVDQKPFIIDDYKDVCEPAEELEGTNTTGTEIPRYMRQNKGTSLF